MPTARSLKKIGLTALFLCGFTNPALLANDYVENPLAADLITQLVKEEGFDRAELTAWLATAKRQEYVSSEAVTDLLQTAQEELLKRTLEVGCNAALGVNTTITTDSSGDRGQYKYIIVCLTATPAVVVTSRTLPMAQATVVEPLEPCVNY